jgi:hypothetical protein
MLRAAHTVKRPVRTQRRNVQALSEEKETRETAKIRREEKFFDVKHKMK